MFDLKELYHNLPLPKNSHSYSFSARAIIGYENHRIAKDINDNPSLLILISEKSQDFLIANQNLFNLKVSHNVKCEIETDKKVSQNNFSVISYVGQNEDIKDVFLKTCQVLIKSLGQNPSNKKIKYIVDKFIELFRAIKEPPKKTLQGLWSELFLIHQSKKPSNLVKAWHTIPEEKFDFSSEALRIEVKSSSTRSRTHHFSLEQLIGTSKCELFVASIFVEISAGGTSIEDLLNEIIGRLDTESKLIEKMNFVTYTTLGNSVDKINNVCYDYHLAKESLQFYHSQDIPKIQSVPNNVFDVRFKSSLDSVNPVIYSSNAGLSNFLSPKD